MSSVPDDLRRRTEEWIAADPHKKTRRELTELLEAGDADELAERMDGSLEFGTAGLRGKVEAGSNRMNRAVVIRTTRGLAEFLLERAGDSDKPVVIGRDARLSSQRFQKDAVAVLTAAGILVRFFRDPVPTPLVAYAARQLGAQAAVVITASHNPPLDNGYKVYDTNGAQIIPPTDKEIAAKIASAPSAKDVPRLAKKYRGGMTYPVPDYMFERYLGELAQVRASDAKGSDLGIVYTPLHGVGGAFVTDALRRFGHPRIHQVAEQYDPDGHFPTVDFPNPEEPGALDLASSLAVENNADLIIANDPDTDRLSISLAHSDGWRPLTGNQIGVLLADYLLSNTTVERPVVLNSIVSSPMLASVAESHGARFVQTLTGFKWIWNAALDVAEADGSTFVFGYEEALGYSVGPAVRDKDGISAAVIFADLAAACHQRGESVLDYLARLYDEHGLWASTQKSIVRPGSEGAAQIAAAMERIGAAPPSEIAGIEVVEVTDYRIGAEDRPRYLAATPLVALDLGSRGRALVRPSGTEPKLKIYVDLVAARDTTVTAEQQERTLVAEADGVAEALAEVLGL
ncbi:MAG: phospho-sugar mutase [Acidimicrobiia bacterium]|nr:phospho-sugar mutase [Acidimicrobiia bacterium]